MPPLLRVDNLVKSYPIRKGMFQVHPETFVAVDHISFRIHSGETLGIVGESGSGKTTTGRTVLFLEKPTSGTVLFEGRDIGNLDGRSLRSLRRQMQMIFQDPFESLNSRMTVGEIIEEPFFIHRSGSLRDRHRSVLELLDRVGLPASAIDKYPHEFSGGQRQRIGIARAIALRPKLIVCDEPVSSLDVSIQGQILNLLIDLQQELGMAYLFISHNLSVVKHISDRVAVMYRGRFVETAPAETLYRNPLHPYTRMLIDAIPTIDVRKRQAVQPDITETGAVPPSTGCHFAFRCPMQQELCIRERPELAPVHASDEPEHLVACHCRSNPSASS
uniref:ATP-binding cassette domain-containing protein n=1 Tax=Desulfatirhabdium butyrativorans TaxID=340467 RepID=A0A7C4MNB1_9BACT